MLLLHLDLQPSSETTYHNSTAQAIDRQPAIALSWWRLVLDEPACVFDYPALVESSENGCDSEIRGCTQPSHPFARVGSSGE